MDFIVLVSPVLKLVDSSLVVALALPRLLVRLIQTTKATIENS